MEIPSPTGTNQLACPSCPLTFTSKVQLQKHKETHHKTYVCRICLKSFGRRGHLVQHAQSHKTRQKYQCRMCEFASPLKGALTRHKKEVHNKTKDFRCTHCDKKYSRQENLESHSIRIHDVPASKH